MSKRSWKVVALITGGGLLLQGAGCATILVQLIAQNIFASVLRGVLDAALGDTGSSGETP